MSASDTFTIMQTEDFRLLRWLEIEGLPYCYGTGPASIGSTFFASRAAEQQFLGIKCWLKEPPPVEDVELDVLEAFPRTAGALEGEIVDVDGTVTALVRTYPGSARLAADVGIGDATIVYIGQDPGFGSSGTAYIGNETITYSGHNAGTKTLSGVLRGRYRSIDREWGRGIPIHLTPYTMKGRRIWYYTAAAPARTVGSAFFGFTVDRGWLRFSGTLDSLRANGELTGFTFKATSLEKDLDRDVFRNLRQLDGPPLAKIRGLGSTEGLDVGATWQTPTAAKLRESEVIAARLGDEIVAIQRVGLTEFLRLYRRALMNTEAEEHKEGSTLREVVLVCPGVSGDHTEIPSSVSGENYSSYFSSYGDAGSLGDGGGTHFPADHPLAVLLGVMLSGSIMNPGTNTTDGNGYAPPLRSFDLGTYAPAEWFLGIDATRLDLKQICQLGNETAWLRTNGVVEESVNFIQWAKSLLQPFGFYVTYTAEGLFTVKPTRPPLPGANLRKLDDSIRIGVARPSFDANLSAVISSVEFRYGWDIRESRFRRVAFLVVNEGALYSGGRGRELLIENKLMYTGSSRIPGELTRQVGFNVEELIQQRGDFYQCRYARPPAILIETVKLDLVDIALGDLIAVTSTNLPNTINGLRGLDESICEVIGKRVDEVEKTMEITVLMTGFEVGDYRLIGPAAIAVGGTDQTISFFFDPPGDTLGGRAGWYDYSNGASPIQGRISGNLIDFFPLGATVRRYPNLGDASNPRWDFTEGTYDEGTVASFDPDAPSITLDAPLPNGATVDGDLFCFGSFPSVAETQAGTRSRPSDPAAPILVQEIWAFLAGNDGFIDSGGSAGHKFFPA